MPTAGALISINEREERDAQRAFYDRIEADMSQRNIEKLKFWYRVNTRYAPIGVLTFMSVYWIAGLIHAGAL